MDPGVVAGVGNIYANEALYEAGVAPHRIVSSINKDEAGRIVSSVQEVLRTAIKMGGTTLKDYRNAYGEPGFFQQKLAVYGRKGQPCYRCGAVILKTRMGQRSSYMCPHCQK